MRDHGYTLMLGNSEYDSNREESYLELVRSQQLAGAIFCLGDEMSPILPHLQRAVEEGLAVVLVHSPMASVPTVCADNRQGGRLAAQHLLDLGHRAIGIISALPLDEGMADREGGFLDVGTSPFRIIRSRFSFGSGTGIADIRACVYGCSGLAYNSAAPAISTIRPRYMTATRVEMCSTTARPCEMKR